MIWCLFSEDDMYVDNVLLPPPSPADLPPPDDLPLFDEGALPPPPPDIMPPPPPEEGEELYADMFPVQEDDNIYTDNIVDMGKFTTAVMRHSMFIEICSPGNVFPEIARLTL